MAVNSYGTIFRFAPEGGQQVVVGSLASIGEITSDSEEIDVTALDSAGGYREYVQGYRDAGVVSIEGFHTSGDAGQAAIRAAYASGKAGNVVIAFPDGAEASFRAYVKSYSIGAAKVDGAVGFSAALRITGGVTFNEG